MLIFTPRLTLRPLTSADAPALYAMFADPEAMRYWSSGPWTDPAQGEAYVAAGQAGDADGSMLRMGIELDGALAGVANMYRLTSRTAAAISATCWRAPAGARA